MEAQEVGISTTADLCNLYESRLKSLIDGLVPDVCLVEARPSLAKMWVFYSCDSLCVDIVESSFHCFISIC